MSKKTAFLVSLSESIEEMRLPIKGRFIQTQLENWLIALEGTVFRSLYYGLKKIRKVGNLLRGKWAAALFVTTILILCIFIAMGV